MNAVPSVSWLFPPTAFHKLGPPRHGVSFTPSHGTRIAFPVFAASLDDEAGTNSPLSDSYGVSDPIKLAFERAKAYKKSKTQSSTMDSVSDTASQQQKKNVGDDSSSSVGVGGEDIPPSVKIAMDSVSDAASQQQKKNVGDDSSSSVGLGGENIPPSVKIAMEKAKEYAKEKSKKTVSLKDDTGGSNASVEGVSVDWRKERDEGSAGRISNERRTGTVSRLDFLGLNFADKKNSRGLPSGLVPRDDPFPPGELPEVEIIVGDQSKFASPTSPKPTEEDQNSELYKPNVSTWGVFPRPGDISKTYGGGRTIRPGEVLESAEAKAAKEARTRQLLSEYKVKMGLNIDPQIKSECQEALQYGNDLMECGRLQEAINCYERIMNVLAFQTELHGLAALQWSICQDSLSRSDKARTMYEKLQSHPNTHVSKKAKQFLFGFQAMEMLKVRSMSTSAKATGYQNYFEAFVEERRNYSVQKEETEVAVLKETVPYFIILLTPILFVLFIAARNVT